MKIRLQMKDKIQLFVLEIKSVDDEIQTFRPESLMAEIKDSHVNYYRKLLPKNSLALLCSHYKI